jgi:hypothetical protein
MGHWGKAGQALAGSIRGYGLPDMQYHHAVAISHAASSRGMVNLCAQRMPHQYMCIIRWCILPHAEVCNKHTRIQHRNLRASRRVVVRALSQVAGGAVLGKHTRIRTKLEA